MNIKELREICSELPDGSEYIMVRVDGELVGFIVSIWQTTCGKATFDMAFKETMRKDDYNNDVRGLTRIVQSEEKDGIEQIHNFGKHFHTINEVLLALKHFPEDMEIVQYDNHNIGLRELKIEDNQVVAEFYDTDFINWDDVPEDTKVKLKQPLYSLCLDDLDYDEFGGVCPDFEPFGKIFVDTEQTLIFSFVKDNELVFEEEDTEENNFDGDVVKIPVDDSHSIQYDKFEFLK